MMRTKQSKEGSLTLEEEGGKIAESENVEEVEEEEERVDILCGVRLEEIKRECTAEPCWSESFEQSIKLAEEMEMRRSSSSKLH